MSVISSGGAVAVSAIVAAFILSCAADGARATSVAADRGRAIAETSCAECHAVGAGAAASPNEDAPTFQSLADRPDMTRTALAVLLRTPHRSMPNLIVPAEDIDDLAAYLASLRTLE